MSSIIKTLFKFIILLTVLSLSVYTILTLVEIQHWCDRMQISITKNEEEQFLKLNEEDINSLGTIIEQSSLSLTDHFKGTAYEKYNTTGLSVWRLLQVQINDIIKKNIVLSLFVSISITTSYAIIISRKLSNPLKIVLGYWVIIFVVPPLYMYSYTGKFWNISAMYLKGISPLFYMIFTFSFLIFMYLNYKNSVKLKNLLNKCLK